MTNQHEMYKVRTHDSGDEEWQCTECERRLLFEVETLTRIVLQEGNSLAQHYGYGMDVEMTSRVASGDEDELHEYTPTLH
jgi:hypothetical protein